MVDQQRRRRHAAAAARSWSTPARPRIRTRRFLEQLRAATGDAPIPLAVKHPPARRPHLRQPPAPRDDRDRRPRSHPRRDSSPTSSSPSAAHLGAAAGRGGDLVLRPRSVTLRSDLTLHTGDPRGGAAPPGGPAHTAGDARAPGCPTRARSSPATWCSTASRRWCSWATSTARCGPWDWLAAFQPAVVIPGHGPVLTGSELPRCSAAHERYYRSCSEDTARPGARGRPHPAGGRAALPTSASSPTSPTPSASC